MLARENEALKDFQIKDYEHQIKQLNHEIKQLNFKPAVPGSLPRLSHFDPVCVADLQYKIDNVKECKSKLESEFIALQTQWKLDIENVNSQLQNFVFEQRKSSHVNCTPNKTSSDDDDDEALFVPKQKNHSNRRHSEPGDWKLKFEDKQSEYEKLLQRFVLQEEMLEKKEKIHAVEIDTIVKSLTNKRTRHHVLKPSTNLLKSTSHVTDQTDFLYKCLQHVKRSDDSEVFSAP